MQRYVRMPCNCFRWAFRLNHWHPTSEEWLRTMESIQVEEVSRINGYHFREDAKAAAVGRLMLRRAITVGLGLRWEAIRFGRTEKGKPILLDGGKEDFSFNISHQGDFVLLATNTGPFCGVDVMKINYPRGTKSVDEYLNSMKRQFSRREFESLGKTSEDKDKLTLFYRYWCLKESYIKALGVGIHNDLSNLDFQINSDTPGKGQISVDTRLFTGKKDERRWKFEESLIDDVHIAAVCIEDNPSSDCLHHSKTGIPFNLQTVDDLLQAARPLHVVDAGEYEVFCSKSFKSN